MFNTIFITYKSGLSDFLYLKCRRVMKNVHIVSKYIIEHVILNFFILK